MLIRKIDEFRCDGCGFCEKVCMGDVIRMSNNDKATIAYPEDCAGCIYCEVLAASHNWWKFDLAIS